MTRASQPMRLSTTITPMVVERIVESIPDDWLVDGDVASQRRAYVDFLVDRLQAPRAFFEEAVRAGAASMTAR